MTTTSNIGITLVEAAQAQKEVTVNEAFTRIDALLNTGAMDKDLATPPNSPATGDLYIVAASNATDAWEGKEAKLTYYDQIWRFISPRAGMAVWVNDEEKLYRFNGTVWLEQTSNGGGGGSGGVQDGEVTAAKLANNAVTSTKIADDAVTLSKLSNISSATLLGNMSGSNANPSEISVLDEDDMASNSATALVTQQSVKAYVDANAGGGSSTPADGSITTAKLANNAVSLGKMATMATAKVLGNMSGATAAPAEISILDEDNMASNSATALATQQSIKAYVDANAGGGGGGTGGAFTEIAKTIVSSSVATVDLTIPGGYAAVKLLFDGVDNNGEDLWLRVDTGSGFASSQYFYGYRIYNFQIGPGATTASSNAAQIIISVASSTGTAFANGEMDIFFNDTRPTFQYKGFYDPNSSSSGTAIEGQGYYNLYESSISQVRFMRASGNISQGNFTVIGIPTS